MKAKEYFKNYKHAIKSKIYEVALHEQFEAMFVELNQIKKDRKANTDDSIIAIFNEVNYKANLFIKRVNGTERSIRVKKNSFKTFIKDEYPDLYKTVWN